MGIDYLESLFTGMDIIIDKRLKELSFDKTIVCTVVNNEKKKDGEYRVSDGAIEFIAYSFEGCDFESRKKSSISSVSVSPTKGNIISPPSFLGLLGTPFLSAPAKVVAKVFFTEEQEIKLNNKNITKNTKLNFFIII